MFNSGLAWVMMASFFWAMASQIFSWGGRKVGSVRLNLYKSLVAWPCFVFLCLYHQYQLPNTEVMTWLLLSGMIGLAIGDYFLFMSFITLGPSRTLILQAFNPVILAVLSFMILDMNLGQKELFAIALLVVALISYAQERKKSSSRFKLQHIGLGLLGVTLDAIGLILSKKAFLMDSALSSEMVSAIRLVPAIILFAFIRYSFPKRFDISVNIRDKVVIAVGALIGTFLALLFYIQGLSLMHPALVGAVGGLAPIYSTILESVLHKRWPSRYILFALFCMICALMILTQF